MPAVVVTGARQTGKSTLVEQLVPGRRRYRSLDDLDALDAARRDPEVLLGSGDPVTLDEVQRAPALLRAVKRAIDRDRAPGRFLITGSAHLLLMRRVSESVAGRASYLTVWPMTRCEQRGTGRCGLCELLAARDAQWRDLLAEQPNEPEDWRSLARRGGYPVPTVAMKSPEERAIWFDGYVRTYIGRDLQVLASTSRPRLSDAGLILSFRAEHGKKARAGILLHTGNKLEWLAPEVLAAPWWRVP